MTDQTATSDSFADSALVAPESEKRKPREFEILLANVTAEQLFNFRVLWFRANGFTTDTIKKSHALYETLRVQYAGKPDIEKTEKIIEGTKEIPKYKLVCVSLGAEVQDLVYFLAHGTVNRTIHEQLVPNDWTELALLHLGQISIPDRDTDKTKTKPVKAIAPPKKKPDLEVIERKKGAPPPPPVPPKPAKIEDANDGDVPKPIKVTATNSNKEYKFIRESAVPYKPWTLTIGDETYHLNNGQKAILAYILDAGQPKTKTQMKDYGVAFNIPAIEKLKEMGILHAYSQKGGDKRLVFYGVETDGYRPQYNGYFRKDGVTSPVASKESVPTPPQPGQDIIIGALKISPSTRNVTYEGERLAYIAARHYQILLLLARRYGEIVTTDAISKHFHGNADRNNKDRVHTDIQSLTRMIDESVDGLGQSLLMTVGDKGYALTLSIEDRQTIYQQLKGNDTAPKPKDKGPAATAMGVTQTQTPAPAKLKSNVSRQEMLAQVGRFKLD